MSLDCNKLGMGGSGARAKELRKVADKARAEGHIQEESAVTGLVHEEGDNPGDVHMEQKMEGGRFVSGRSSCPRCEV